MLLGLTQALAVILGFFGLGIILRHYGYPDEPPQGISSFGVYHWTYLALFLRQQGLILLLLPLIWIVCAAISENRTRFVFPFGFWMILGALIPCTIVMTFFYAIFRPFVYVATN
jgi:hypothetical protein